MAGLPERPGRRRPPGSRGRPGALLRSDDHCRLTPAGMDAIRALGVCRVLDLRWDRELAERPSPFAGDPIYQHVPLLNDRLDYEIIPDTYGPMLDHNKERIGAAFRGTRRCPARWRCRRLLGL